MQSTQTKQNKNLSQRLKELASKFGISPASLVMFVILGFAPLFITDNADMRVLVSSLMYGAFAMAFDFTSGFININNFGFSAFWGLGAYTSGILMMRLGISPWIGMFAGAAVAAVIGFLLGILTIRLGGIFASCMTWFVAMALFALANNLVDLTGGAKGLTVGALIEADTYTSLFYVILVLTIAVFLLLKRISHSNIGLAFRAIGQDVEAAQSSGINPVKYKIMNFTVSCAVGGLIGGFYAHFSGIVIPKVINTSSTTEIIALAFIGGRGSIWGGLLCAVILMPIMESLKNLEEMRLIIYGALMIFVMIFYPKGLSGIIESCKELAIRLKNKMTKKEAADTPEN